MALLRMEGFDVHESSTTVSPERWYDLRSNVAKGLSEVGPFTEIDIAPDNFVGNALSISNSPNSGLQIPFPARSEIFCGIWYNPTTISTSSGANNSLLRFGYWAVGTSTSFPQVMIRVNSDGSISATRGTTSTLGTSAVGVVTAGNWHRIEVHLVVDNSSGVVEVLVDGVSVLNLTSIDTQVSGSINTTSYLTIGSNRHVEIVDSLYIVDTVATPGHPVGFLNDWYVETVYAATDAGPNNFTPVGAGTSNADRVSEQPFSNWGTTHNVSASAGDVEAYTFNPLQISNSSIVAIQLSAGCRKDSLGMKTVRTRVNSGGTAVTGPTIPVVGPDYQYNRPQIEVFDPNTGVSWTNASVEAAVYEFEIVT